MSVSKKRLEQAKAITGEDIHIHFQPIVHIEAGQLLGYEALSRGAAGSKKKNAEVMFNEAWEKGVTFETEALCQEVLLAELQECSPDSYIFVNLETSLFGCQNLLELPLFCSGQIIPKNFVIELTERNRIKDHDLLKNSTDRFRKLGFKIAFDDVGSDYCDLTYLEHIRPDFIKVHSNVVQGIAASPVKQRIFSSICELAERSSSFLIAEGVENFRDYLLLRTLGADFGQGFYFGTPKPQMSYENNLDVLEELSEEVYRIHCNDFSNFISKLIA